MINKLLTKIKTKIYKIKIMKIKIIKIRQIKYTAFLTFQIKNMLILIITNKNNECI